MALRLGSLEDKAILQVAAQIYLNHFECLTDILCFEMMLVYYWQYFIDCKQ